MNLSLMTKALPSILYEEQTGTFEITFDRIIVVFTVPVA